MSFDYYVSLVENKACPKQTNKGGLASGFVDGCTVWSCQEEPQDGPKNEARQCYMKRATELTAKDFKFPDDLNLKPDFTLLPDPTWFGLEVSFTLQSPWYSKDDRPFHVLDNPVRKDRVFGVPFMSAASWKGLLRWAYRMKTRLIGPELESDEEKIIKAKDEIIHLFGNEMGEQAQFNSGALVFCPTWFKKIGFEVINPHSRARRAGIQPIYYEVVPAGTEGCLQLLYAPLPGEIKRDSVVPAEGLGNLIDAVKLLLETYGISAKRTAGWGAAKINDNGWNFCSENDGMIKTADGVKAEIKRRFVLKGGGE